MSVTSLKEYTDHHLHNHAPFVVSVANLSADILPVWSTVNDALCIMDVSSFRSTSRAGRFGRIFQVNEDDTGFAFVITWHRADRVGKVGLFVDNHVVSASSRQSSEQTSEVTVGVEIDWLLRVDVEQLNNV
jgi:hypothetical protein